MGGTQRTAGIRPLRDRLDSITKISIPKNEKDSNSFLGAKNHISKSMENLSANTNILRKLLKKRYEWIRTDEHTNVFYKLKEGITKIPTLLSTIQHIERNYNYNRLCCKKTTGKLKPVGIASRFLSDTEKNYAINELEFLAVVWQLEHFRFLIYGKPIEILSSPQALESLLKSNRSNRT